MVVCNQFGYGCSDEATIMIVAGTIKAVLQEIGIADITAQNIARGIPSRASIVKAESDLAADCMVKVCAEMIKDRAEHICIITDHGHRKGQDHFVKLIVWFGKDLSGKPTLKHHCVDIDMGGHAAKAAANAVKISTGAMMKLLKLKLGDDVELSKITGDSGGGASVIDRTEIVNDRFVMYHWDCITYLAASDTHVDLLGGNIAEPLRPLSEGIWKQVLIHAVHQQRCENYVQLSGLIALTGVGEARRSCRAVIVSDVIRRFNQWGLDRRNAYLKSKNKTPVKRLQGTQKTQLFLEYADIFFEDVDKAKHELGNNAI